MPSQSPIPPSKGKVASINKSRIPKDIPKDIDIPPPYTAAESKWLEKNKPLVRALIQAMKAAKKENNTDSDDEDDADAIFSEEQLKWVKDVYGTSENFLKEMKYDPTKPKDCAAARAAVECFGAIGRLST